MNRPEQAVQRSILAFLHAVTVPDMVEVFHIPNGGRRSKAEAAIFKSLGVKSGVPDLCLLRGGGRVGFLEVKKDATGRPSENQRAFMAKAVALGVPVAVVWSIDQVRHALRLWGVPTRESGVSA
jgi:hypothetical protein